MDNKLKYAQKTMCSKLQKLRDLKVNPPFAEWKTCHGANGIQEVSGSIPLISIKCALRYKKTLKSSDFKVFSFPKVENSGNLPKALVRLIFDGNSENQEVRYDEENQDELHRTGCGVFTQQYQQLHAGVLILVFNKTVKNRFIRLLFQQPAA